MWKKEEIPASAPTATPSAAPTATPIQASAGRPEPLPHAEPTRTAAPTAGRATIGRSITIRGEVTGDEDLLIQGRVDGSVNLKQHSVTVGPEGQVKADIVGRIVTVEGRVEGNLAGDEQVILRSSAWVAGDITSPRVILEDGTHFRGSVDMGENDKRSGKERPAQASREMPAQGKREPEAHVIPRPAETGNAKGSRPLTEATAEAKR